MTNRKVVLRFKYEYCREVYQGLSRAYNYSISCSRDHLQRRIWSMQSCGSDGRYRLLHNVTGMRCWSAAYRVAHYSPVSKALGQAGNPARSRLSQCFGNRRVYTASHQNLEYQSHPSCSVPGAAGPHFASRTQNLPKSPNSLRPTRYSYSRPGRGLNSKPCKQKCTELTFWFRKTPSLEARRL